MIAPTFGLHMNFYSIETFYVKVAGQSYPPPGGYFGPRVINPIKTLCNDGVR